MIKIKLLARRLDGVTLVEPRPNFEPRDGWLEGTLPSPAGLLPAGLWGKVPAGDPYLLHVNVLSTKPLEGGDIFELQSGAPMQPRARYRPEPSNYQVVLVRPTDRLRLLVAQEHVKVELLVESIGGENELGSRLFAWSQAARAGDLPRASSAEITGPAVVPAWTGVFHLIHTSAGNDTVHLPPRGLVPLDAMLTVTRRGAGKPVLKALGDDTLSGGLPDLSVTRTMLVMNNGDEWAAVGS